VTHESQRRFCFSVRSRFPEHFENKKVLDCGSLDINGNNTLLFIDCDYVGIDLGEGPNVDVVSKIHEFKSKEKFDTIISTQCFEHDMYYEYSLKNIIELLREGGMFLFTCATKGTLEHGTIKKTPFTSPFTILSPEWGDYYKNLEESDIRNSIDVDMIFDKYEFLENKYYHDLYFWGIKK